MRNRLAVSVGVLGLILLAWGGWARILRSHDAERTVSLESSLTEKQFDDAATGTRWPEAPSKGGSQPVRDEPFAIPPQDPQLLSRQAAEYRERQARSPLELQMFRRATAMKIRGPGQREGAAVLIDLNPRINDGYVLELRWSDGEEMRLHLENARPDLHRLVLDPAFPSGIVVASPGGSRPCELWSDRLAGQMKALTLGQRPYIEICEGDIQVRHRTAGSRTSREWATDFLRSNVRRRRGADSPGARDGVCRCLPRESRTGGRQRHRTRARRRAALPPPGAREPGEPGRPTPLSRPGNLDRQRWADGRRADGTRSSKPRSLREPDDARSCRARGPREEPACGTSTPPNAGRLSI
jgi:hypothetical protein